MDELALNELLVPPFHIYGVTTNDMIKCPSFPDMWNKGVLKEQSSEKDRLHDEIYCKSYKDFEKGVSSTSSRDMPARINAVVKTDKTRVWFAKANYWLKDKVKTQIKSEFWLLTYLLHVHDDKYVRGKLTNDAYIYAYCRLARFAIGPHSTLRDPHKIGLKLKNDFWKVAYCMNVADREEVYMSIDEPIAILGYCHHVQNRPEMIQKVPDQVKREFRISYANFDSWRRTHQIIQKVIKNYSGLSRIEL